MLTLLTPLLFGSSLALATDRRTPIVEAIEAATPAVVTIEVQIEQSNPFFGTTTSASEGSGVIITADGLVLTNAHVVLGGRQILVRGGGGGTWQAEVLALDADIDLAVLQLADAQGLTPIALGDSDHLFLGEPAIAVGNPLGLGLTVSTGVVSSVQRDVEIRPGLHQSYIQTDAAINPGNSGGALVNLDGELIGINTAIRADAEGIGFAIPVNRAKKVAADLVNYGTIHGPWLGLDVADISSQRLRGTPLSEGAIQVERVWQDSPADHTGITAGDLLFEIDGHRVLSRADLNARIAGHAPGDVLSARWLHRGVIGQGQIASLGVPAHTAEQSIEHIMGVSLEVGAAGLIVTSATAEGSWTRARLRPGDIIIGADGVRVQDLDALYAAIRKARAQHRRQVLFTVRRGRHQGHMDVEV